MEKLNLVKQFKDAYTASAKKVKELQLAPAQYLSIRGKGAPGEEAFSERIAALYGMAFTIKMTRKFKGLGDYVVSKLEGLYWLEDGQSFDQVPKHEWRWDLLIRTPEFVVTADLRRAIETLEAKGKPGPFAQVELRTLKEGHCVQMMHIGPYDQEGETMAKMQRYASEQKLQFHGHHHEIYLSDPRRTAPDRLKTILRHPVRPFSRS